MNKMSTEDKKFFIDQLRKERMATALEAILLQMTTFSLISFLNMAKFLDRFAVSLGLIYTVAFIFSLSYSIVSFLKNRKRLSEIIKIEKMVD